MTKRHRPRPPGAPPSASKAPAGRAPDRAPADRTPADRTPAPERADHGAGATGGASGLEGMPYPRLGAASGVAFALLAILGSSLLAVGDVEPTDAAGAIAERFTDVRGTVSLGILMTLFAVFFLMVFVAYLHRWLRTVEGERGWLATLGLIGGVLLVGMLSVVLLLSIAATVLGDYGDDPVVARTLLVLNWQALALAFMPAAAFIGAVSLIGVGPGRLPRYLTYSGLALAAGLLVPPVAPLPYLFSTLWIGMLAVTLLTRAGPRPKAAR